MQNKLYFGDNLDILRRHIPDGSVDLIYIDPPFNSNRNYFVLFKDRTGSDSAAQEAAFEDTWTWTSDSESIYNDLITTCPNRDLATTIEALRRFLKESPMMAYLTAMAIRFTEMLRVIKPTGSFYLHCDPVASHYLKVVLDVIFGPSNFRNEITWKRTHAHGNVGRNYGSISDIILWYTKSTTYTWNQSYSQLTEAEILKKYPNEDVDGRRWQSVTLRNPGPRPNLHYPYLASNGVTYQPHPNGWSCNLERMQRYEAEGRLHFPAKATGALRLKMFADESVGERLQNIWNDIPPIPSQAAERLGYPTQKPLALLERIINTSSNVGDTVLDCYCGCGTTVAAAHKLGRKWIGIDITAVAVAVIKSRLENSFDDLKGKVRVDGFPTDFEGARQLFEIDPHRFQVWACTLIDAFPLLKKGADAGVDGWLNFLDLDDTPKRAVVQVKGGKVQVGLIRDFCHVVKREEAAVGFFISLSDVTEPMRTEALKEGYWTDAGKRNYAKVQLLTISELLSGSARARYPSQHGRSLLGFKAAPQEVAGKQAKLFEDR